MSFYGVMTKVLVFIIVESEFKLQSRSYVHIVSWERYEFPYPPNYGLNRTITVL